MSKFINFVLAVAVFAAAGLWMASGVLMPRAEEAEEAEPEAVVQVVSAPLTYEDYVRQVRLSGRTEARYSVTVTARTAGVITDLPMPEGSFVTAGDVIAELSDEARAAAVTEARANLEEARAQLRAGQELAERGFLPALELEQRRASVASQESALERAVTEAARGVVVAPVSGVLERLIAEPGQAVSIGADIASVLDLDPIVVAGEASERAVGEIRPGALVDVTTLTGQSFQAEVRFVSKAALGATRTFRVEAEAPNPDADIAAGLTAQMLIETPARAAARVPRSAITLSGEGEIGVMLVDDESRAEFAPVVLMGDAGDVFWIAGPPDGAEMIVVGQEFVAPGSLVRTTRTPAGLAANIAALEE